MTEFSASDLLYETFNIYNDDHLRYMISPSLPSAVQKELLRARVRDRAQTASRVESRPHTQTCGQKGVRRVRNERARLPGIDRPRVATASLPPSASTLTVHTRRSDGVATGRRPSRTDAPQSAHAETPASQASTLDDPSFRATVSRLGPCTRRLLHMDDPNQFLHNGEGNYQAEVTRRRTGAVPYSIRTHVSSKSHISSVVGVGRTLTTTITNQEEEKEQQDGALGSTGADHAGMVKSVHSQQATSSVPPGTDTSHGADTTTTHRDTRACQQGRNDSAVTNTRSEMCVSAWSVNHAVATDTSRPLGGARDYTEGRCAPTAHMTLSAAPRGSRERTRAGRTECVGAPMFTRCSMRAYTGAPPLVQTLRAHLARELRRAASAAPTATIAGGEGGAALCSAFTPPPTESVVAHDGAADSVSAPVHTRASSAVSMIPLQPSHLTPYREAFAVLMNALPGYDGLLNDIQSAYDNVIQAQATRLCEARRCMEQLMQQSGATATAAQTMSPYMASLELRLCEMQRELEQRRAAEQKKPTGSELSDRADGSRRGGTDAHTETNETLVSSEESRKGGGGWSSSRAEESASLAEGRRHAPKMTRGGEFEDISLAMCSSDSVYRRLRHALACIKRLERSSKGDLEKILVLLGAVRECDRRMKSFEQTVQFMSKQVEQLDELKRVATESQIELQSYKDHFASFVSAQDFELMRDYLSGELEQAQHTAKRMRRTAAIRATQIDVLNRRVAQMEQDMSRMVEVAQGGQEGGGEVAETDVFDLLTPRPDWEAVHRALPELAEESKDVHAAPLFYTGTQPYQSVPGNESRTPSASMSGGGGQGAHDTAAGEMDDTIRTELERLGSCASSTYTPVHSRPSPLPLRSSSEMAHRASLHASISGHSVDSSNNFSPYTTATITNTTPNQQQQHQQPTNSMETLVVYGPRETSLQVQHLVSWIQRLQLQVKELKNEKACMLDDWQETTSAASNVSSTASPRTKTQPNSKEVKAAFVGHEGRRVRGEVHTQSMSPTRTKRSSAPYLLGKGIGDDVPPHLRCCSIVRRVILDEQPRTELMYNFFATVLHPMMHQPTGNAIALTDIWHAFHTYLTHAMSREDDTHHFAHLFTGPEHMALNLEADAYEWDADISTPPVQLLQHILHGEMPPRLAVDAVSIVKHVITDCTEVATEQQNSCLQRSVINDCLQPILQTLTEDEMEELRTALGRGSTYDVTALTSLKGAFIRTLFFQSCRASMKLYMDLILALTERAKPAGEPFTGDFTIHLDDVLDVIVTLEPSTPHILLREMTENTILSQTQLANKKTNSDNSMHFDIYTTNSTATCPKLLLLSEVRRAMAEIPIIRRATQSEYERSL